MSEGQHSEARQARHGEVAVSEVFPVKGYLLLNAVVWAFSALLVVLVKLFVRDIAGMVFFAVVLSIGFGVVSIFDALYDRLAAPSEAGETDTADL